MVSIVERKWLGRWKDSSAVWVPLQKEMSRVWLTRKEGLSWGPLPAGDSISLSLTSHFLCFFNSFE